MTAYRYRRGPVPPPALPEAADTCWAAQRAVLYRFMECDHDPGAARSVLAALGLLRERPRRLDDDGLTDARTSLLWDPEGAISRPEHTRRADRS